MKLLIVVCLLALSSLSYAVSLTISPDPVIKAQCPLVGISYTVSVTGGGSLPKCSYNWTVTGGTKLR
jgi:hypothetical protein